MFFKNAVRRVVVSAAVVAAAMSTLVVPAQASMEGCNGVACILIKGKGLHVDFVRVGLEKFSFDRYAHFHIWGGGIDMNTPTKTYSWDRGISYTLELSRSLPDGAQICTEGWEHLPDGSLKSFGRPCGTIKS
ncbi:hypothetical protein [Allokutzneria albata]|uniref:Peptidase inhibitor family I36 n=1 Tax=Allokutzneria albata TaxID=211114 RepID=A0A1G9Z531_ALLAB|nr:hypothetical protein [Allokutzneria albata]SDN15706.1 hypothetical protein SAMN04489726_5231 [Allokutzneria albata]